MNEYISQVFWDMAYSIFPFKINNELQSCVLCPEEVQEITLPRR
jgi:hypothetical protein